MPKRRRTVRRSLGAVLVLLGVAGIFTLVVWLAVLCAGRLIAFYKP